MGRITKSNDRTHTHTATHTIATPSSAAAIQVHKNLNKNQFYWQREVGQADKQLATQLATLLAICQTTICHEKRKREKDELLPIVRHRLIWDYVVAFVCGMWQRLSTGRNHHTS